MNATNYRRGTAALLVITAALALTGCPGPKGPQPPPAKPKEDPKLFVEQVNKDLLDLNREANAAGWTQATDITVDTQYLNSRVTDRFL